MAKKQKKYYVTMTDKFMSGWGHARGKINKYIIECNTAKQAETIACNANKRSEMKAINITRKKPYYNPRKYLESNKKYAELGRIWKKKCTGEWRW